MTEKVIDKSKRVAPGCVISTNNILTKPRTRKNVDYTDMTPIRGRKSKNIVEKRNKENVKKLENQLGSLKIKDKKSKEDKKVVKKNAKVVEEKVVEKVVEEKVEVNDKMEIEEENEEFIIENPKENTDVVVENKTVEVEQKVVEEKQVIQEKVEEKVVEEVVEKKGTTQQKNRKSAEKRKSSEKRKSVEKKNELKTVSCLSQKNIKLMKEAFEVEVPEKVTGRRYSENEYEIPNSFLQFLSYRANGKQFENERLNLTTIEFSGEFVLSEDEMLEYQFLRENTDAMLIADGDNLIAVKQLDTKQDASDFFVYILFDDNKDKVDGPYKLSELLSDLNEIEIVEEEDDE
jgi:hypothetical protein